MQRLPVDAEGGEGKPRPLSHFDLIHGTLERSHVDETSTSDRRTAKSAAVESTLSDNIDAYDAGEISEVDASVRTNAVAEVNLGIIIAARKKGISAADALATPAAHNAAKVAAAAAVKTTGARSGGKVTEFTEDAYIEESSCDQDDMETTIEAQLSGRPSEFAGELSSPAQYQSAFDDAAPNPGLNEAPNKRKRSLYN